ncbi:DNA end protector protein [Providencia phage PSTCR6]|nr:DNA end protector protein [Providencia phage PSTCR6]
MSIFRIEEDEHKKPSKENEWVQLGVEFHKARSRGKTSKAFAEEKGIKYSTFTSAMSKYASRIKMALEVEAIRSKSKHNLTKRERELVIINDFRSKIKERIRNEGAAVNNKSNKWFVETIKKGVRGKNVSVPIPGKIYTYIYDAKNKETLPYWDKFPLIIYLGAATAKNGNQLLYGLNLHYIPPKARQMFLEELLKNYASTSIITSKTKLKIDWSKVKGMRGSDLMIKAYLPGHIKGPMIEIKPQDWPNVITMPTQQFMSQGSRFAASKVWSQY